ncbi:prepilin-type N-terminal cleavage/methylation domain-containing protein [bacterium]|nr:prepilin-type N-terminal cleavage/methylation domain-containing protein [bacterium]
MKGFTIIEVMIALFILLVGITGVIRIQISGSAITSLSNNVTFAQNIAQSVLQHELAKGTTALLSQGGNCVYTQGDFIPNPNPFNYTITCSIYTNMIPVNGGNKTIGTGSVSDKTSTASVLVTVSWDDTFNEDAQEKKHQVFSVGMSAQQ